MIYRVIMDGNDILNFQERQFTLINPSLTMELNTAGSFEFTMPPSHELYDDVKPLASTISVYEDESLLWFGRPVEIRTDFYKQKAIYCEGALAFFNDTVQRPHEYDRISLHTFFQTVIENHNAQVGADRQFTVGTITVPDKTVYRKLNYDSSFDVLKRQCLGAEGGYLFLRREDGINYIDWYKEIPYSCNQPVEFGLNMLDLTRDFDGASIVTCVIPLGDTVAETGTPLTVASVNDGSDVIESEAVEEYGRITKAITFNGVSHADTLYEDGLEYLQSTQFNNLTIECTAAELHWQNENYGQFRLGQKVRCRSNPHLLDRELELISLSMKLDSAEKRVILGTHKQQSLTAITKDASDAASDAASTVDDLSSNLDDINSTLGDVTNTPSIDDLIGDIGGNLDDIGNYMDTDEFGQHLDDLLDGLDKATIREQLEELGFDVTAQWLIDILYILGIDLDEERDLTQEELKQILEAELDQMRDDLGNAESYEDLLDLTDDLDDFWTGHDDIFNYDTGDSTGYDDIGSNISDTSGRVSGSTGGSNLSELKTRIVKLEKANSTFQKEAATLKETIRELTQRVDNLRDYNELMSTWEREVNERITALEDSERWIHQINGVTAKTGTVNFITEA